jgi:hypothetical protein
MSTMMEFLCIAFGFQKPLSTTIKKILGYLARTCGKLHLFGTESSPQITGRGQHTKRKDGPAMNILKI